MLIKLPSGDWINPVAVMGVKIVTSVEFKPFVVVMCDMGPGTKLRYDYNTESEEEANSLRDQVADQVNAALYQERKKL